MNAPALSLRHALPMMMAMAFAGILAACTTQVTSRPEVRDFLPSPSLNVAQQGNGGNARFIVCADGACPGRTRKEIGKAVSSVPSRGASQVASGSAAATVSAALPVCGTVYFRRGSAVVDGSGDAPIRHCLVNRPLDADTILLVSRTDITASQAVNDQLAARRADNVLSAFSTAASSMEMPMPRVQVDARGRCCYAASNDTAASRSRNRRVELAWRLSTPVRATGD